MTTWQRWWVLGAGLVNVGLGLHYRSVIDFGFGAVLLALLASDWWNRRGRKAAKTLGAKSAALLARLARDAQPQQ